MPLPGVLKAVWHHQNDEDRPRSYRIEGSKAMKICARTQAVCRCGHICDAHQHFRPGTDCGLCAQGNCQKYRRRNARRAQPDRLATSASRPTRRPTEASTRLRTSFVTGSKLRVRWWCGPGLAGLGAFDDPLNGLVGGVADFGGTAIGVRPRGSRNDAPVFALTTWSFLGGAVTADTATVAAQGLTGWLDTTSNGRGTFS